MGHSGEGQFWRSCRAWTSTRSSVRKVRQHVGAPLDVRPAGCAGGDNPLPTCPARRGPPEFLQSSAAISAASRRNQRRVSNWADRPAGQPDYNHSWTYSLYRQHLAACRLGPVRWKIEWPTWWGSPARWRRRGLSHMSAPSNSTGASCAPGGHRSVRRLFFCHRSTRTFQTEFRC